MVVLVATSLISKKKKKKKVGGGGHLYSRWEVEKILKVLFFCIQSKEKMFSQMQWYKDIFRKHFYFWLFFLFTSKLFYVIAISFIFCAFLSSLESHCLRDPLDPWLSLSALWEQGIFFVGNLLITDFFIDTWMLIFSISFFFF